MKDKIFQQDKLEVISLTKENKITPDLLNTISNVIKDDNINEASNPNYRYSEGESFKKVKDYIDATYGEHYIAEGDSDMQCLDVWIAQGSAVTSFRDTIMKYLWRVGKKGESKEEHIKDVMKAIHYCFFLLHVLNKEKS